jgi:energy-converting hydrogenase Eha subunit E
MQPAPAQLLTMRILTGAFMGGLVIIGVIAVVIAPTVQLPPVPVSLGLLALVVLCVGGSELLLRRSPALRPDGSGPGAVGLVQSHHIVRMAVLEAPAMLGLAAMFVIEPPSFVTYLVPAVPALLAMALLVFPHRMTLERYERALDRDGARSGLAAALTGRR